VAGARTLIAVILTGVTAVACRTSNGHQETPSTIAVPAAPPAFVTPGRDGLRLWRLTKQFYQARGNTAAWTENRKPRPQMDQLIGALQRADQNGLDPALYDAPALAARRQEAGRGFLSMRGFDAREVDDLDLWLTYLYLEFASDLTNGVADLPRVDPEWRIHGKKTDVLALLEQSLDRNQVGQSLEELTPSHAPYGRLRDALQEYRRLAQQGGWPRVPATLKLKPGQRNAAIPILARRLAATGDFTGTVRDHDPTYGLELEDAVRRFQRRHGLTDDGAIAAATVTQLNVPVERRIDQIALNLERWRWLPHDLGRRYVLVNIPEYRLEVWDHDRVLLSMRVVVGTKDTPTPIFNDDMTYVVFAPYWNVPPDIVSKETIPSAMKDPAFLERTNMEVLDQEGNVIDPSSIDLDRAGDYRFRQRPGGGNSLGFVKFMFPNQYNVYLHDTPADSLFARTTRSFSHGCVRLEQPEALAQYVLADQPEWTQERIEAAMHGGQEKTVKLRAPLPVYLGYWTARMSADGILQFRDDLYGIDERQASRLDLTLDAMKRHARAAVEGGLARTRR
jgi:murein L,D-transpeptidase YcbB/YkuD